MVLRDLKNYGSLTCNLSKKFDMVLRTNRAYLSKIMVANTKPIIMT